MPTKKQNKKLTLSNQRDKRSIAKKKQTLSCATGLRNFGASAKKKQTSSSANGVFNKGKNDICNDRKNGKEDDEWVFDIDSNSNHEGDSGGYDGLCLPDQPKCKFLPLQQQAMQLLSMAVPPEDRDHFKERFHAFATGKETSLCPLTGTTGKVCNTNAAWIAAAYGCNFVHQLQCAGDMFPFSRMESCFLSEIYTMDVILNRLPLMKTEACAKRPRIQVMDNPATRGLAVRMEYVTLAVCLCCPIQNA
jgi:hypothetical protein